MPKAPALLAGKVIFVTGGADGIGRECALAYAREGAHVVVADKQRDIAQETVAELRVPRLAVYCDLSDGASVEAAIQKAVTEFSGLDAVHNNAGIASPSKALHETAEEEWEQLHRVNVKSVYWTTRFGLELLAARRGCILNTASMVGLIGQSNHAAYVSTKGALIALTKAMALDYAPLGIRVNAICPSAAWTPLRPPTREMSGWMTSKQASQISRRKAQRPVSCSPAAILKEVDAQSCRLTFKLLGGARVPPSRRFRYLQIPAPPAWPPSMNSPA